MSAFMMNPESTAKIATYIVWNMSCSQPDLWINSSDKETIKACCRAEVRNNKKVISLDIVTDENLFKALEKMNAESLKQRYGDNLEDNLSKLLPAFPWYSELKEIEILKLVQCCIYQCSEGNISDTKLYKTMESISHVMCYNAVSKLPEYEAAVWG